MDQKAIELILMRQLASYLMTPIFVVDGAGGLLFYNEPAEALLGRPYQENAEMPLEEWTSIFKPTNKDGSKLPADELPLLVAL
jgi:hypothetical protein